MTNAHQRHDTRSVPSIRACTSATILDTISRNTDSIYGVAQERPLHSCAVFANCVAQSQGACMHRPMHAEEVCGWMACAGQAAWVYERGAQTWAIEKRACSGTSGTQTRCFPELRARGPPITSVADQSWRRCESRVKRRNLYV